MSHIDSRQPRTVPPSKRPKRRPAYPRRSELVGSPRVLPHDAAYRRQCELERRQARRDKAVLLWAALLYFAICVAAGVLVNSRGGLQWM